MSDEVIVGGAVQPPVRAKVERLPFRRMVCPVEGCNLGKGGLPREGAIPGVKRHVAKMHPDADAEGYEWPDLH